MRDLDLDLPIRPRRNRKSKSIRAMVCETRLSPSNFIWPIFVMEGKNQQTPIKSMPGVFRWSLDLIVDKVREAYQLGIPAVALFPAIDEKKKNSRASESKNSKGLLQNTIRAIKDKVPEITVISDVAMDPYSSDGHDGLVHHGQILNDPTLDILAEMAISQAEAGADMVAPSDMMDGRIGYIRGALDQTGYSDVGILAYSAKYASAFYGPFREALDSAPKSGDKKTYQMDPANAREAIREVHLDVDEGADMVMVKPAMAYLDIIQRVKEDVLVPVAAYQVSGEYAMLKLAASQGLLDERTAFEEALTAIKRAGADLILSYYAVELFQKSFSKKGKDNRGKDKGRDKGKDKGKHSRK